MRELETLLPDLAPPMGGLARLQRSVAAARRPTSRLRPRWAIAVAACVVAAIVAAALPPWIVRWHRTEAMVQALRSGAVRSAAGIEVADGAAVELPSGQANARLYLVQSGATRR